MQLKNILCTLFALGVVGTAYAADEIITGGAGTCNADVLGTAENGATANTIATWSLNEYDCPAGQYLMVDGENIACTPCASGSYCPGGIFTVESEEKGTYQCPTDYASSVGGSDSQNDCYQGCSATCTQQPVPLHAINVTHGNETASGKHYYGGSCDATSTICSLSFQCDTGYHKRPDLTDEQAITLYAQIQGINPDDLSDAEKEYIISELYNNWESIYNSLPSEEQTQVVIAIDAVQHPNRSSNNAVLQPLLDLLSSKENANVSTYTYQKNLNGVEKCKGDNGVVDCDIVAQQNTELAEFRRTAQNGDWFAAIPEYEIVVSGKSKCDYSSVTPAASALTYINGYARPVSWVYNSDMGWEEGDGRCEESGVSEAATWTFLQLIACAHYLAGMGNVDDAEIETLKSVCEPYSDLSEIDSGAYITYMCDANKIGIDWNPDDGSENISGMCLYGGDVNVPDYIPTKPGYTFKGWKLITQ